MTAKGIIIAGSPLTPERRAEEAKQKAPDSHKVFFGGHEATILPDHPAVIEARNQRQRMRRRKMMGAKLMAVLEGPREELSGSLVLRISFNEWVKMREDPKFIPFRNYAESLFGVRKAGINEVGKYTGADGVQRVVTLKDAGPDDKGDGKYHQVHRNTPLIGDKK